MLFSHLWKMIIFQPSVQTPFNYCSLMQIEMTNPRNTTTPSSTVHSPILFPCTCYPSPIHNLVRACRDKLWAVIYICNHVLCWSSHCKCLHIDKEQSYHPSERILFMPYLLMFIVNMCVIIDDKWLLCRHADKNLKNEHKSMDWPKGWLIFAGCFKFVFRK